METGMSLNQLTAQATRESGNAAGSASNLDDQASRPGRLADVEGSAPGADVDVRMEAIAERLQEFVRDSRRRLEFEVDRSSGEVSILVRHAETGKLLRTIPPEEARVLAERMSAGEAVLLSRRA
jgi:flagellar protein FlaG